MSPARTLENNKYEVGARTGLDEMSFVVYIALPAELLSHVTQYLWGLCYMWLSSSKISGLTLYYIADARPIV